MKDKITRYLTEILCWFGIQMKLFEKALHGMVFVERVSFRLGAEGTIYNVVAEILIHSNIMHTASICSQGNVFCTEGPDAVYPFSST